ncbi:MAG: transposase [Anaerolineaceae bacterium]|nr:transposase [Anaerolineaceae bacterium]
MNMDSTKPLTISALASLIQPSDAIAIAIRLVNKTVIHAGKVSDDALAELNHLLITSWNHLDTIEPPHHMISELGGQSVLIQSSFVNENSLVFLAFHAYAAEKTVDTQTEAIIASLKTFDLSTVQQPEKPAISDWFKEDDKNTQEYNGKGEPSDAEQPASFGSSLDPVISQTHVVNDLGDKKDPDLGEFPLADVISLINEDESTSTPSESLNSLNLNPTDESEWQILENMTQEKAENQPSENLPDILSINSEVIGPAIAKQNGWYKQINEDQTQPPQVETNEINDQPLEPGQIDSTFFYLVPRINYHFLIGDLSQRLRQWVPEICKIYDWDLGLLSVRPDYLRWSLQGFPEYSIPGMLKILREETSKHIFTEFPGLKQENVSGDYWSSSYLIDRDDQHFSTQALILMISKDRLSK